MSEETAVAEFSDDTKVMGDKIAEMTLKQAKELSDYLKDVHGIEPAAGGGAGDRQRLCDSHPRIQPCHLLQTGPAKTRTRQRRGGIDQR